MVLLTVVVFAVSFVIFAKGLLYLRLYRAASGCLGIAISFLFPSFWYYPKIVWLWVAPALFFLVLGFYIAQMICVEDRSPRLVK